MPRFRDAKNRSLRSKSTRNKKTSVARFSSCGKLFNKFIEKGLYVVRYFIAIISLLSPVLILFLIAWVIISGWNAIHAADLNVDMLVYRGGGDTSIPEYRTHNDAGFGTEATASDIVGSIEFLRVVQKPDAASDEKILCSKDGGNDINCDVWSGSWGGVTELSANSGSAGSKTFDVAYEHNSGDAMVCYRDISDTSVPFCDIWNGTDWNTAADANDHTSTLTTMQLIPDPNSDAIALIAKDTKDDVNIQIWNGGAWGNLLEGEIGAGTCDDCFPFSGAWESSGQFVAVWFDDASDELQSVEFTSGTGWGTEVTGVITGLSTSDDVDVLVQSNPDSGNDELLVVVADGDDTLTANRWGGTSWGTQEELDAALGAVVSGSNHLFYLAYEHENDFDAIVAYGSVTTDLNYRVWDSGTTSWGSATLLPTAVEDKDWISLAADPNSQRIMLTTQGVFNDVDTLEWSGSVWDAGWTNHDTLGDDSGWNAWFTYDYELETDVDPPTISTWDLNMTSGTIQINFNEAMDTALTPVFTTIILQNAATATSSFTLTGGTHAWLDSDTVEITFTASDLNSIKEILNLATAQADSYIRVAASSNFEDAAGNALAAIADGSAIQVTIFTADTVAPTITTWDLNVNAGYFDINFSEPLNTSTVPTLVGNAYLQDAAPSTTSFLLSGSSEEWIDNDTLRVTLCVACQNTLKKNTGLATSVSNSYLRILAGTGLEDVANNAFVPLTDSTAIQVTNYTADTTSPSLISWSVDLSTTPGTIELTFNEPVSTTTLDVTQITLQDAATATSASTTYVLTDSTTESANDVTITLLLSSTDKSSILSNSTLLTDINNSYLRLTATTIDDMVSNAVNAIDDGSALQALIYGAAYEHEFSAYRFFNNLDSTDVSSTLAAQDTPATLVGDGDQFRLRILMHLEGSDSPTTTYNHKLQFATKVGTCDLGFVGETYLDVVTTTDIAFYNNPTPSDGDSVTSNVNDPSHLGHTIVFHTYEENHLFPTILPMQVDEDGLWDFSLIDNDGVSSNTYCLRVVDEDGGVDEGLVLAEVTTALGNVAPAVTTPASITQATDGSGYITFQTTISDIDSDTTTLRVEYSDDGGSTFYDAELISVSSTTGTISLDNSVSFQLGATDPIDTDLSNVTTTIVWDTQSVSNGNGAVTGTQSDIQLRVTPYDGIATGTPATSGNFSVDNEKPVVTALSLTPSSGTLGVDDVLVLNITAGEAGLINSPVIIHAGHEALGFTDLGGGSYTADHVIEEGHGEAAAGTITSTVVLADTFGNTSTLFSLIATNTLAIDPFIPVLISTAVSPSTGIVGIGDVVTMTITTGETGLSVGACTMNGLSVTSTFTDNADNTYDLTYTLSEGDADWATSSLPISCTLEDAANATTTVAFTDGNTLRGDANSPVITSLSVSPSSGFAKIGDTVTLFVSTTEAGLSEFAITVNSVSTTNFTELGGGLYSVDYVVAEGQTDVTTGTITASVIVQDAATNTSTEFTTIDVNTLAIDANSPVISTTVVSPSSGTSKIGDLVTVTLTAGETGLSVGACTLNSIDVSGSFADNADNTYTLTYTVAEGNTDWTASNLPISCVLTDTAGNAATTTAFTDSNTLAGDANSPVITTTVVSPSSGTIGVGITTTITLTTGEIGLSVGACTLNSVDVSGSFTDNADNTYTLTYTVAEGNSDWASGALPISCALSDSAGNTATTTAFTDSNTLVGDANTPTISATGVSPSLGFAKVDDTLTITITSTETGLSVGTCTVNSIDVSGSFTDNADNTYTFTYTVAEGNSDWATSSLSISCALSDAGSNSTTTVAFDDGNTLAGDANTPVISTTAVTPSSGIVAYGTTITTTLSAGETGLSVGACTVNGEDVSGSFVDNADNTYTLVYTFESPDPDFVTGTLPISCALSDIGGNTVTTTVYNDSNTLIGDGTPPNITATGVSPDTGTVGVGDTITATITTTETGLSVGACTLNGEDVSGSFIDNGDNTYSLSYTLTEGDSDWATSSLGISCVLADGVGNTATTTAFDDGNTLIGDANSPSISLTTVLPSTGRAQVGDAISAVLTTGETGLTSQSCTVNSINVSSTLVDNNDNTYTFTYLVAEGNSDWATSTLPITCVLQDAGGNTATTTAFNDGNTLAGDANSPVLSATGVSPSVGTVGVGDILTITITSTETGLSAGTCTVNSVDVSGSFTDNADNTYTLTYNILEGNADWATSSLPISCELLDLAGNTSTSTAFDDGNTLVGDSNSPTISATGVSPNFGFANIGDAITVTITSSEVGLSATSCTVNSIDVSGSFTDNADNTYTVIYTVAEGNSDWTTSSLPISCVLNDSNNNVTTTAFDDGNILAGDANSPLISTTAVIPSSGLVTPGATITTTLTAGETGLSVGTCTVNGLDVSGSFVDNADNTYTLVYTFGGGDPDWASGALPIACTLSDLAGNPTTTTAYNDSNTLIGDGTAPTISATGVSPSLGFAKVGDSLTITITSSEVGLTTDTCSVNSVSVTSTFTDNTDNTYTLTYTLTEGDSDWTTSSLSILCVLEDVGTNTVTTSAFTDSNTLAGDANTPTISATGVSPSSGTANAGDAITVTITSTEVGLAVGTCTVNSVDVSGSFTDNADNTYTLTYNVTEGNNDWAAGSLPVSCALNDVAGNGVTTSAFTDSNTLAGDANTPTISATGVSPSSGTANVGDAITVTITSSETGLSVGACTVNSIDVSGSFTDNTDNTYTLTYNVAEGNSDWTSGNLPISCVLSDGSNNVTTTAFDDGNTLAGDANSPVISATGVSPSLGFVSVGDTVTVTITSTETGLSVGACTVNSIDVSGSFTDNTDNTYTLTYNVTEGNSNWTTSSLPISCTLSDVAANSSTTTAFDDGNTLAGDANSPILSSTTLDPSSGFVTPGSVVTTTITATETGLSIGTCTVNGVDVSGSFIDNGNNTYTVAYTFGGGDPDWASGALPLACTLQDIAGNAATTTAYTDSNTLAGDGSAPTISSTSVTPSSGTVKIGDIVTTTIDTDETGLSVGACTVNGVDVSGSFTDNADTTYTLTYTVAEGNSDWSSGALPISCVLSDVASNTATTTAFDDSNTLAGDANSPVVNDAGISPSSGTSNVGDAITVTITSTEVGLAVGACTVNGVDVSGSFTDNADNTYTVTYTVTEGNGDWGSGSLPVSCALNDVAGNSVTTSAFTDSNTLAGDANTPTISATGISPSSGTANVGDAITVTITSTETGLSVGVCTVNSIDVSGSFTDNADNTYTLTYTVAEGNSDWVTSSLPISCVLSDGGNNVTTSAFTDSNTLAGDANTPVISATGVSPSSGFVTGGDTVTVTITSTETGLSVGACTLNGEDVSGSFTDNADNTYTVSYTVTEGDSNWTTSSLPISCTLSDAAANSSTTTAFDDGNTLAGDANSPILSSTTLDPSSGLVTPGQTITTTITATETGLLVGACTINGVDVSGNYIDNGNNTYTITYTFTGGDSDWASGALPISCVLNDVAGNTATSSAYTDSNTTAGDGSAPTISSTSVTPSSGTVKIGDSVTTTIDTDETGLSVGACTVNSVDVSGSFTDNADTTYTLTYTVTEGNSDWSSGALPISCVLSDVASNTATTTAFDDSNTLVGDANSPVVNDAGISPSSGTSNVGDTITITITSTEIGLTTNLCTVNSISVTSTFTDNTDNTYTVTYNVTDGNSDWTAGNLGFNCVLDDAAGNSVTTSAFTDSNTLAGDANVPTISATGVSPNSGTANVGDAITVTITSSETGLSVGACTVNSIDVSGSFTDNTDNTYTLTYNVTDGNSDWTAGNLPINCALSDGASNTVTTTAFDDSNTLSGDANTPVISATGVSPNLGFASVGDTITVTITSTETGLSVGACTINLIDVSGSFTDNANNTYTLTYNVTEGNSNWTTSSLPISCTLSDAAANSSTTTAFDDGNTLAGDANSPILSSTTVDPSSGFVTPGSVVTTTITATETGLSIGTCTVNGVDVSGTFIDNGNNTYTVAYTFGGGDPDWASGALPVACTLQDIAGNAATTSAYTDSNTLAGDGSAPTISSTSVTPSSGTVKIGDSVTTTIDTDETGLSVGACTVNGIDVSGSFTDNADTTYTLTYTVAEGNSDWSSGALPISCVLSDVASNTVTTTAFDDSNTLAGDANSPVVNDAGISPSSGTSNVGETITVTITSTEIGLTTNLCTVNSISVTSTFTDNTDNTYTVTYNVTDGNSDWTAGNLGFNCVLDDAAGNSVTTSAFTDSNTLAGDANVPTISATGVSPSTGTSNVGDVITITITSTETGLSVGACTINSIDVSGSFTDNANNTYTLTYTVADGNSDWTSGNLPISCALSDGASNNVTTTAFDDGNTLAGDANSPVISATGVSPSSGFAGVGDTVTVTITSTETGLNIGTCTLNSEDVSGSFTDNADNTYTVSYTVTEGDSNWTTSSLPISCTLTDDAANSVTTTAFDDGNTLAGDGNSPIISSTTVDPSSGFITLGSVVTTTITATETGLSVGTCTVNGVDVSGSYIDNGNNTYTITYSFGGGDPDWASGALPVACTLQDIASNAATTTAYTDSNTLAGDGSAPTISSTSVSPSSGTVKIGDSVTTTIDADESGLSVGACTVNGIDVSGSFTDNADTTYTLTYTVAEGNSDWSSGALPISCVLSDIASNTVTTTAYDDSNTLAGDANSPVVNDAGISPSSGTANVGDTITVTITSTEIGLTTNLCTVNSISVTSTFTDNTDNTYTLTYTVADGNSDWTAGNLGFSCVLDDAAGNNVTTSAFTDSNTLAGDANVPTISATGVSPSTGTANVGDAITVTITSSETGLSVGACTVNSIDVSGSFTDNTDNTYTLTYNVAEGNSDWTAGNLPISCVLSDGASNTVTTSAFDDGNTLAGDANTPVISATGVSPSSGFATVGDTVTVTITSTETGLSVGACTINGEDVSGSFTDNANNTYTLTYNVTEGNSNWTTSSLPISCVLSDDATNSTTTVAFTDSNTLAGDANTPVISSTTLDPSSGLVTPGQTITTTITATETGLLVGACTINGVDVSGSYIDNGNNTYTLTYTFGGGDSDWASGALPISCVLNDVAGNTATSSAYTDSNTTAGDGSAPTISSTSVVPSSGTVKIGDIVTTTIDTDETGLSVGACTVNSQDVSGSFTDNADTTYTLTYTVAEGNSDWTSGNLSISCVLSDIATNSATTTAFDDSNTLVGDANSPSLSTTVANPSTGTITVGAIVTTTITAAETGLSVGTCTVNSVDVSGSFADNADNTYTVAYTITQGDADWSAGALPIACTLNDSAGNSATTTAYTDSNTLAGDGTVPTISATGVSPNSGTSSIGDVITVTITSSETGLSVGTCTVNSVDVSGSFADNADNTYTLTYTVAEGNSDWTAGNLPISCGITDGTTTVTSTAFDDGNTLAGDANSPSISVVAASPSSGTVGSGDTVTITITANETGLSVGTCTVNGEDVSGSFTDNTDNTYTVTYTIGGSDTNWTSGNLPISCTLNDDAGNSDNTTSFTDGNTLTGTITTAPAPVVPSGGNGTGAGFFVLLTDTLELSGLAYPTGLIQFYDGSSKITTVEADNDAEFTVKINSVNRGSHDFSLHGSDLSNIQSAPYLLPLVLNARVNKIKNIFIAPTISSNRLAATQNEIVTIAGFTVPGGRVGISVRTEDGDIADATLVTASVSGKYVYGLNTRAFEKGNYTIEVVTEFAGKISHVSNRLRLEIGDESIVLDDICDIPGDLNGDCEVNLVDLSVAAFWYIQFINEGESAIADINNDGIVDLVDLSIITFYFNR